MTLHRLAASACLTLLVSCSSPDRAAGGVDGNPNFLEGCLLLPSEAPAIGVAVVLSEQQSVAARATATSWRVLDTSFTDSDGVYRFALALPGTYRIQALAGDSLLVSDSTVYDPASGGRMPDRTLPIGDSLVVADFETPDATRSFSRWFSDAYPIHLLALDTSRIALSPATASSNPEDAIEDCGVRGRCFHVATDTLLPEVRTDRTEFFQMFRPSPAECFDLSQTDSVTALVRGRGVVVNSFWARSPDSSGADWPIASRLAPLDTGWTRISIPTAALRFGADSLPWSSTCLHKITFGLVGAGELWIDDIRLHGADVLDLMVR